AYRCPTVPEQVGRPTTRPASQAGVAEPPHREDRWSGPLCRRFPAVRPSYPRAAPPPTGCGARRGPAGAMPPPEHAGGQGTLDHPAWCDLEQCTAHLKVTAPAEVTGLLRLLNKLRTHDDRRAAPCGGPYPHRRHSPPGRGRRP